MKCSGFCLIAVTTCALHAGFASASTGGEPPAKPRAGSKAAAPVRPAVFAPASAPFAKRLTAEQRDEWRFLKDAAAESRFESDAAHLALAKSADPSVRSLAATLVNHHASALATLQQMLHARNMAPPMLSNEQRRALNHLARLQGVKFDREWTDAVGVRSQQEGVQAFEKAAAGTHDPALRSWVARTLPTMRYQLASAERLAGGGGTVYAKLAPAVPQAAIKSADLGEGNMVLGPARAVAVKLTEPNIR